MKEGGGWSTAVTLSGGTVMEWASSCHRSFWNNFMVSVGKYFPPRNSVLMWVHQHPHPDNLLWDLHPVYHRMATPWSKVRTALWLCCRELAEEWRHFLCAWTILCWKEPGPLILQATDFCHSLSYLFRNYCQGQNWGKYHTETYISTLHIYTNWFWDPWQSRHQGNLIPYLAP